MKLRGGAVFAVLVLLLFVGGLYMCTEWSVKARLFPMLIVIAGIGLSALVVRAEIRRGRPAEKEEKPKQDDPMAALKLEKQEATPRSELIMISWMGAFLGTILIFGHWVGILIFTPFFMSLFGHENWKMVAIFTAGIWLLIYFVFSVSMRVPLFGGFLGLAW